MTAEAASPSIARKVLAQTRAFLEMIRFSHTVFALPFALAAAALAWRAEGRFRFLDLLGIIVCMVLARSAAMAFNRLADQRLDAENPRTATRHLPSGRLGYRAVLIFTALCCTGFVLSTVHFIIWNNNWWPLYLSVPVLLFLLGYSYSKRFTLLCHFWLGMALALAPAAAWIAIRGGIDWPPIILSGAVLFWVAGFDILYATQDVAFDQSKGLFSVPARLGVKMALHVAAAAHVIMVGLLVVLGLIGQLGLIYYVGVGLIALLLLYEHWLVRPDDLSRVNQAFFTVNAVISLGLLGLILLDMACPFPLSW
jgi:4-hydroxybenzoate polyprenyltransferase